MRGRLVLAAGLGLTLGIAAPASGSTVAVESFGKVDQVFYRAAPGEANRVVVSTDGATVSVSDPGAEIQPGADCASVNDQEATCTLAGFARINLDLRNRADRGRVNGPAIALTADGGGGADTLVGGQSLDFLDGARGADVLNGRGGSDWARYLDRDDDLRVTLGDGRRNDGGPSDGAKRDRLRNLENAIGGSGNDLLVGTGGANTLVDGAGRDRLRGKGGPDSFFIDDGRDRAYGGGGGDLFSPSDGRDRHYGGKGPDHFQDGFDDGGDLQAGGPGFDTAQYQSGHNRISLDGKANDGNCADPACTSSDEGDNVTGIEELLLFSGDDVLIGSGKAEVFRQSSGADTVLARGGNDTIHVHQDGDADLINCGSGIDTVVGTPDAVDMNPNCEETAP